MIRVVAIIVALISLWFLPKTTSQKLESTGEGEQIILKSREAIGIEKLELNSVHYKIKLSTLATTQGGVQIPDFFEEISFTLPNKIKAIYSQNQPFPFVSTNTWNDGKYKSLSEMEYMGTKMIKDNTDSDRKNTLGVLKGRISKDKLDVLENTSRKDPKEVLIESMWTELFPLILTHPFEQNLEFNYVGKAQSNNKTADVVDFKPKNGKSYRLLFDRETNYLLMMIVNYKRNDPFFIGDVETKYYFTNRELTNGISIPKKIKVENKQTAPGKPPKIGYSNIDILEFEINPEFKKDMFDIK